MVAQQASPVAKIKTIEASRFKRVPGVLAYNNLTADAKQLNMPRKLVDGVLISVKYKVTDAGISAGETLAGCVQQVFCGDDTGNNVFYCERDELPELVQFSMMHWPVTGKHIDDMPTTATYQTAHFFVKGPFDLSQFAAPVLYFGFRPITDEFGGASVFEAEIKVYILEAEGTVVPVKYKRAYGPSATSQEFNLGPGIVGDIVIVGGTVGYLDRVTMEDGNSGTQYVFHDDYKPLMELYALQLCASAYAAKYLIPGCNVPNYQGMTLQIVNSTAEATTVFAKIYQ